MPDPAPPGPDTLSPDVLVIGGGPAGCTAATLLAMQRRRVTLVEKDAHPRFHIGESLLPRNTDLFERLGVLEEVRAMGVLKPGGEFVSDRSGRSAPFAFKEAIRNDRPYSWQVVRSEFDAVLFANAARKGATTLENTRVTDMRLPAKPGERAEVTATGPDGQAITFRPRYVLDASGRDTFLAGKLRLKDANKVNNTAAAFAHFTGVERREGELEGYITIHLAEDGWFWLIPLPNDVMSVGFVGNQAAWKGRKGSAKDVFLDRLAGSPTVRARMAGATRTSEIHSAGNYSYRARSGHGPGYHLIGDAYGFVDPMFSTGVLLAMTAGELGAEAADAWLDDPARGDRLAARADRDLARGMDRISWLITRINDPVLRHLFLNPSNVLRMRDGLISMLAGNLRGDWRMTLPVLSFKVVYRLLSVLHRFGLGPAVHEARPAPALAPAE